MKKLIIAACLTCALVIATNAAEGENHGPVADAVTEIHGHGLEGRINGRRARLGRATYLDLNAQAGSETELWFGFDGDTRIRFSFSDRLRPDARATVDALLARGLSVEILSGDVPGAVAAVAAATGIARWRAGVLPQDKVMAIEMETKAGRNVLMVGDGLNDTAALAKAHAAMAPGTALEASQNAADLVFTADSLCAVVEAIDMARSARHRARENFGFSALYNAVAAPTAMLGLINPFLAALAMSGSSLVVTLNALRTRARR